MLFDFDSLTEVENGSVFTLSKIENRSYEKDYYAQFDLSIEMNLDTIQYKRQGYNFLDFISDIGGMQSLLFSTFAFILGCWNYNMLENYMVSRLYKL